MTQIINIKNRYTFPVMSDKIKKELAIIKFDIEKYKKEIDKYKHDRSSN